MVEKLDTVSRFNADGTGERTITAIARVQSQAGIRQFGNLSIPYEARNQKAEFAYVRVRKPNGSVVETPSANTQDMPAGVTLQAPMYSDLRIKQVPVSDLNPGDTLEYQMVIVQTRAEIPNEFWLAQSFFKSGIVLEEDAQVRVPTSKHVQVVSTDVQPAVRQDGKDTVYEWKTSHLQEESADRQSIAQPDSKPSIQITTFENWEQVGEWYKNLESTRVVVTPATQLEARDLTKGLTTDDAKQRAIYAYVSTQFRYIGLSFGVGRYQPHTAAEVLGNKFGDCKDKHTLFAALMKAAGYDVWPALIGSGSKLDDRVPYPGQFDHVISVLPQGKNLVWLDTTEEVAPYGMLAGVLRDKQALVIPTQSSPELKKTPISPPFAEADNFTMKAVLNSKSILAGHADLTTRGDLELGLRAAFHITPEADWTKLVQNVSYLIGFSGDVSRVQADNPDNTAMPFHLSYDYERKDYGGSDGKQITPPLPAIQFALGEKDKAPKETIPLGGPGVRDYRATVELPKGDIATLPQDTDIQTAFAEYRESSSVKDGTLSAERYLNVKTPKLPAAQWDDYLKFVKAVQDRENLMIPIAVGNTSASATGARYSPEADELIQQAYPEIRENRQNDAEDKLRRAQALNPTQWGLWATYSYLYLVRNQPDRAIDAFHKEIANHPDDLWAYQFMGPAMTAMRRPEDAAGVWRSLLQIYPDNAQGNLALGALLVQQKHYDDAIALLKKVADGKSGNTDLQVELGTAELNAGQKDAGIAELKTAMRGAETPTTINDAAYELADHDDDAAEAATFAGKALQQVESSTDKTTLAGLSNDNLRHVDLLGAIWDTVGWIDFKQAKYPDAERYVQSAWLLEQRPGVADHLGQVYQKEGKLAKARRMYKLALARNLPNPEDTRRRLQMLDKNASAGSQAADIGTAEELSKLRTFEIPGLPRKMATAEFFLLLSPQGVEDVKFLSGNDALHNATELLKKTKYGPMFPDSGPERIVRQGVLSCSQYNATCQFVLLLPQWTHI